MYGRRYLRIYPQFTPDALDVAAPILHARRGAAIPCVALRRLPRAVDSGHPRTPPPPVSHSRTPTSNFHVVAASVALAGSSLHSRVPQGSFVVRLRQFCPAGFSSPCLPRRRS
jgi:hypothetical protein